MLRVAGVLSQLDEDNQEHPIAYYSRKLLPRGMKYSTVEECLAIRVVTHAFKVYLLGKPFKLQTDHRALLWLNRLKYENPRLLRWSLTLQPFQIKVCHSPGKENVNADTLSRSME